jgi:hypothetical protein
VGQPEVIVVVDLGRRHHRRRRRHLDSALPLWFMALNVDGPTWTEQRR